MFAFFKRRIVIAAIGFVLLAFFIWFVGPYFSFGFGDALVQPLGSETSRLVAIGGVVVLWLLALLFKRLKTARASDKLMAAVVKPAASAAARPAP